MLWTASYRLKKCDEIHTEDVQTSHPPLDADPRPPPDPISEIFAATKETSVPANVYADVGASKEAPTQTGRRKKRAPINRPSERAYTGMTSIRPNIIDHPMVTENREQRLARQQRFLWLCNAWSPPTNSNRELKD